MNRDLYAHVPKVHCPKENIMVPILWCMGGFVQQRYQCSGLVEAVIDFSKDYAEVKCKAEIDEEWVSASEVAARAQVMHVANW